MTEHLILSGHLPFEWAMVRHQLIVVPEPTLYVFSIHGMPGFPSECGYGYGIPCNYMSMACRNFSKWKHSLLHLFLSVMWECGECRGCPWMADDVSLAWFSGLLRVEITCGPGRNSMLWIYFIFHFLVFSLCGHFGWFPMGCRWRYSLHRAIGFTFVTCRTLHGSQIWEFHVTCVSCLWLVHISRLFSVARYGDNPVWGVT